MSTAPSPAVAVHLAPLPTSPGSALWAETRTRFGAGGPFLFGSAFTLADAFYAPVVCRFATWKPELDAPAQAYANAVGGHPLVAQWVAAGRAETWRSPRYEEAPAP